MRAEDAAMSYSMRPHEENGSFVERHYAARGDGRPASGSIYYYLAKDEVSNFHVIDCDEYWVWSAGSPLETWTIAEDGSLERKILGLGPGMEPMVFFPSGSFFAARHRGDADDGTFVTCITVPRFHYEGWRLVPQDEVVARCAEAADFFDRSDPLITRGER